MPNRVRIVRVTDADRVALEWMSRDRGGPARVAERARIVLLSADGLTGPGAAAGAFARMSPDDVDAMITAELLF